MRVRNPVVKGDLLSASLRHLLNPMLPRSLAWAFPPSGHHGNHGKARSQIHAPHCVCRWASGFPPCAFVPEVTCRGGLRPKRWRFLRASALRARHPRTGCRGLSAYLPFSESDCTGCPKYCALRLYVRKKKATSADIFTHDANVAGVTIENVTPLISWTTPTSHCLSLRP